MSESILLCTDLDRTVLPNGAAPESSGARVLFRAFVERPEVVLAYVSGRSEALIREAVEAFEIPMPDHAIGDVGTSLFDVSGDRFVRRTDWDDWIAPDWSGRRRSELAGFLDRVDGLELQEPDKQAEFKLSYYVRLSVDRVGLLETVRAVLESSGVRASVIWSIDDERYVGLLDVLPRRANKLRAIRFLRDRLGVPLERCVFAGDSGNDLDALASEFAGVVVANASDDVRDEAMERSERNGTGDRLYFARGGLFGMNGNYAAGVLEGTAHFVDDAYRCLEDLVRRHARF